MNTDSSTTHSNGDTPLAGRVAVITGASRGIGRAFALRLASEGASIVVAAKSETDDERLPGTIHSVAEEVRALGAEALPVRCDVRHDSEVEALVHGTVERFGRLDILINNAGALWWESVLDTPPKRYDLMWQINVRAAYLGIHYALPEMIRGGWGHIVNCSPPISTEPSPGYVTYMTTKMGMTRLAIGVADEVRDHNIAANSLWPATPIESYATLNWDKMGEREQWRSPAILCDALVEILRTEPSALSGRQIIDEDLLRERGWTDEQLDAYWLGDGAPTDPIWIDGRDRAMM